MVNTVFLVGAGFSLAANARLTSADQQFARPYPLAKDLGLECFGPSWDSRSDIELSFARALEKGDPGPIDRLVKRIQTADYDLGYAEATANDSPYAALLNRFPGAQFVSFNYDSLLEQVLEHRRLWYPHDGFGVRVEVGESPGVMNPPMKSSTRVLHLHGSVLLYAVEFAAHTTTPNNWMLHDLAEPNFLFDPHNLQSRFTFSRAEPGFGYQGPPRRVVVPIPDKSQALLSRYSHAVYARACETIRSAAEVTAIGYRFAVCDESSYRPLLKAAASAAVPVRVISPGAHEVAGRLRELERGLSVISTEATFQQWVASDFA